MNKVLLIKDDEVTSNLFKHVLEEDGDCEVVLTRNGNQAIQIAKDISPALIITDLFLPGKSGVAVLEEIKRDPLFVDMPAIIFTAEKEVAFVAQMLEGNADLHLPKPINLERLKHHVKEILARIEA